MKLFGVSLLLITIVTFVGVASPAPRQSSAAKVTHENLIGRWRVKFTLSGSPEKNLVFNAKLNGSASFRMLDTGPDDKPDPFPASASWSRNANDRVSFSSEVELPLGTCCRETGTLMFKGNFASKNSITGSVIFVTSTTDTENIIGFRSSIGTFSAERLLDKP